MKLYLTLLLAFLCAACSEKEHQDVPKGQMKSGVYFNDFESEAGWGDCQHKSISSRIAHSGKYSIQVDNDNPFGMGFRQPLGNMIGRKPAKVEIEAWVNLPNKNASGSLVLTIVSPANNNQQVFYQDIRLHEKVKEYRKWVKVTQVFELPENISFTDDLQIYPWKHDSPDTFHVDDLKITVME